MTNIVKTGLMVMLVLVIPAACAQMQAQDDSNDNFNRMDRLMERMWQSGNMSDRREMLHQHMQMMMDQMHNMNCMMGDDRQNNCPQGSMGMMGGNQGMMGGNQGNMGMGNNGPDMSMQDQINAMRSRMNMMNRMMGQMLSHQQMMMDMYDEDEYDDDEED